MLKAEAREMIGVIGGRTFMAARVAPTRTASTQTTIAFAQRYLWMKRVFDVTVTLLLLCPAGIPIALVAIAIKLDSPGPVIYRQRRVGLNGAEFDMFKFRSMYHNSDDTAHRLAYERYMKGEALNGNGNGMQFKLANDPRITRVGRFIRKSSLDEFPQLWNVLRGEMSLVGPRPPIPYEVERYSARSRLRLCGKPGLTGPWQVHGRSQVPFDRMVEMDIAYLQQQSLLEDLKLILSTVPAVLLGRGGG